MSVEPQWKAVTGWRCDCRGPDWHASTSAECPRRYQVVEHVPTYPDVPVRHGRREGEGDGKSVVAVGRVIMSSDQQWFGVAPKPVRQRAERIPGSRKIGRAHV